jgi:DNA polymerase III subunit epsilon
MPAEAEAVHGLSDAFLADKPLFAAAAQDFLDFIEDSPMIAHNAGFDFNFINFELTHCGHPIVGLDRMVDTVALAKVRHPGAKLSLDALCSRYGIDRSHRTKHGALLDAELLAQVYVELRGGRQIGLELLAETTEIVTEIKVLTTKDRIFRQPRPHAATEEELAAHTAFLKSVDTPLWGA